MINKEELIFTVDENNQPIETVTRRQAHTEGIWHRVADIVVINSNNEILCNQRSMLKDNSPGKWDIPFGGHALAGTDMVQCAMDELREESGIVAKREDLTFYGQFKESSNNGTNNQFFYVYIYKWNGKVSDLTLEVEEIVDAKWVSLETLRREYLVEKKDTWTHPPYMEDLLNETGTKTLI